MGWVRCWRRCPSISKITDTFQYNIVENIQYHLWVCIGPCVFPYIDKSLDHFRNKYFESSTNETIILWRKVLVCKKTKILDLRLMN